MGWLSCTVMPLKCDECATLTFSDLRPVSGCTSTAGCSETYSFFASARPSDAMRSSRVFDTSASDEVFTTVSLSRMLRSVSERLS